MVAARSDHVSEVRAMLAACVRDLQHAGIDQWDDVYPDLDAIGRDVREGTLFVAVEARPDAETKCLGAVCLSAEQDAAYRTVAWQGGEPALVVHRLCVDPASQGRGVAARLMDFVEMEAAARGAASLRLDAYTGNPAAVRLYARRGYTPAGEVRFPRRALPFVCMEKSASPLDDGSPRSGPRQGQPR